MPVVVKAIALVLFVSAIGGATYGVQSYLGDSVAGQLVNADPARGTLNATGGQSVTYAVSVVNRDASAQDLRVGVVGEGIEARSVPQTVPAAGERTFFVTIDVPGTLVEGEHLLDVQVLTVDGSVLRAREGALTLRVMGESPGFEAGDEATVVYTGRIATTGRVFNTNDAAIEGDAFPKTETYSFSPGALTVRTVPRPTVVTGFYEGMLGMQPGESRTITFPPEKGYGNATITETQAREQVVERDLPLELKTESVQRATFDEYVAQTGQGEGAGFEAGEVFRFEQGTNRWPYRIASINETTVEYVLAVEAGEVYTLYPFWEGASVVERVNDTHAVLRTTPTTGPGETFTMRGYWPNMSAVKTSNETAIVVQHSPPVGYQYQVSQGFGEPRQYTVSEVGDAEITVVTPSSNPLAGQDLTFDVRLVELKKG